MTTARNDSIPTPVKPAAVYDLHGFTQVAAPADLLQRHWAPFRAQANAQGRVGLRLVEAPVERVASYRPTTGSARGANGVLLTDGRGLAAEPYVAAWKEREAVLRYEPGFSQAWLRLVMASLRVRFAVHHQLALLRASCFDLDGQRIAIVGWSGSGKSHLLLEALRRGAGFVGDDWVLVSGDGDAWPIDCELKLTDDALRGDAALAARVGRMRRAALRGRAIAGAIAREGAGTRVLPASVRAALAWTPQLVSSVSWARFAIHDVMPDTVIGGRGPVDVVVSLGQQATAASLSACTRFEFARDLETLRFGSPAGVGALLDTTEQIETDVFAKFLAAVPTVRPLRRRRELSDVLGLAPGGTTA